ncbi:Retrovirus-related Pol polyprotein from transposon TNT 1-94 [Trichinella murrelli]|uniref:Retrovirus-related Pol polyprotein from transposon TNT 1-94 n=1 Tax=Trichinella murrelli TaxID=144512 RepID=A0A0V0UIP0_9BILA|nr:Retrovirus-related Pol polyprotein from transposon TNT 1-94 [Trichinella murrelli]
MKPYPVAAFTVNLRKECKAIAAICLTVEDDQLIHLAQLETAREMWLTLQRLHERASIGSKLYLMRKLYGMRFTHSTMQSDINGILEIVTQSRGLSKNIEDEDLVAIMLCSLPDSYSALITALKGRDEADLTVEYLQREKDEKARYGVHHNELFPINQKTNAIQYRTFATREKAYKGKIGDWYVDSGATSHMTCNRNFFESLERRKSTVYLADNTAIQAEDIGHGWLFCVTPDGTIEKIYLKDVLYIPSLETEFLSAPRITNNGYKIMFQDDKRLIFDQKEWHRRMGHRDPEAIRKLNKEKLANGIDICKCDAENDCEICLTGKMTSTPFPKVANRAKKQIELIHSDRCGPMPTATPSDHRYMMTFIDDYSRFTVVYLLKTKDEAVDRIKDYVATLHTKFGRNPVTLRTDNGREYVNQRLRNFLREKGIEHQFSAPYTPEQNGVAERKNRALVEMARCMLTDAKLPERFWGEAVCTAAYLQNRLPSRSISKTPFELWTGIKPNVEHIQIFGSKAYSYIPKQKRRKWDNKAREGVIVGYGGSKKGYRLLNPRTNEIWISHSVKIIEDDSHMKHESAVPKGAIERSWEYDDIPKLLKKEDNVIIEDIFGPTQEELSGEVEPIKDGIEAPTLRRSRRINKGIPPKRLSYNIRATQICEPTSWEEVIKLPARERNKWIAAAEEEMTSLKRKGVFELVEPPDGCNVISSKWIFNAKRDASGKIHSYKARLVARGFSQRLGEDYDETFAPVVKHETIRTLLSIAAVKSLHVRHFDVKCAYLNAELPEKLYMEQPPGLEDTNKDMVWQLKRSIYGLKQSARAWNTKARKILTTVGFRQAKADLCLYIRKKPSRSMTYVLLYVDDLLIAAENEAVALTVNKQLNKYIEVKDLGEVSYYLGIQIERKLDGTFLIHQKNKIMQLLESCSMQEAKPVAIPMETNYLSSLDEPSPALPDNQIQIKMETPTERDWKSAKRIIRYLAGTANAKLCLSSTNDLILRGHVDADWAGEKSSRKSTSGYVFQLGHGTIAWSTKRQTIVALSTTEAEYVALAEASRELLWLRQLLNDFGVQTPDATTLYEDNQGCIRLVESDRFGRLHKRRLFLEELGKALVQPEMMRRNTLPRTAAAKSAVERLRKDGEQPSTSGITDTDTCGTLLDCWGRPHPTLEKHVYKAGMDIVLQKWAASPPQSLPYTVRKAIEQIGTEKSAERSEASKEEKHIYRRCVFCGRKRDKKNSNEMVIANAINDVNLIVNENVGFCSSFPSISSVFWHPDVRSWLSRLLIFSLS